MKRASTPQIREDKKDQKQEMPWFQEEFDVHRGFIFQQHVEKDVHSTALAAGKKLSPGPGIGISSVFAVLESVVFIARVESAGDSDERFSKWKLCTKVSMNIALQHKVQRLENDVISAGSRVNTSFFFLPITAAVAVAGLNIHPSSTDHQIGLAETKSTFF
ncbi:hypothetical protein E3N88_20509 [Mikania micrantha]|uniref:Uncharacterized protein n=1 Tax=Mikania micrantha TaxID=192012 RepID=A0A5N6NH58_9ASTR|nr:hypothetical protein E3N88_20509 [Mikania micrantha]